MKRLYVLFLFIFACVAKADVALLVHGYLGSAATWKYSGVSAALFQQGWQRTWTSTNSSRPT